MYDGDDPGAIVNDFLLSLFVPGIVVFVGLWAAFRLVYNDLLLSLGLAPIVPQSGAGAVSAGYGRFLLLIVLTAIVLLPYLFLYAKVVRPSLKERGLV